MGVCFILNTFTNIIKFFVLFNVLFINFNLNGQVFVWVCVYVFKQ